MVRVRVSSPLVQQSNALLSVTDEISHFIVESQATSQPNSYRERFVKLQGMNNSYNQSRVSHLRLEPQACLYAARKPHPPSPSLLLSLKADTHFTIPQRVEG